MPKTSRTNRPSLSSTEIERIVAAADRLRGEFAAILELVPHGLRSTRQLAKHLALDRNICQRFLAAVQRVETSIEIAALLPGAEALRQIIHAFGAAGYSESHARAVSKAAETFERTVREIAGSRATLVRLIESHSGGRDAVSDSAAEVERGRHMLFRGAAELLGRWSETQVLLSFMRPSPEDRGTVELVGVSGLIGHHARTNAVPLVGNYGFLSDDPAVPKKAGISVIRQLAPADRLPDRAGVVRRFTSKSVLGATVRPTDPTGRLLVVDAPVTGEGESFDVVNCSRVSGLPHPKQEDDPVCGASLRIRYPAERLVFDAYLHRSMAKESVPSAGSYTWDPRLGQDLAPVWYERLPSNLGLTLLGHGIEHAATRAWSRHLELTQFIFSSLGWDPAEFVGHRIEQAFPVWNSHYFINFDFRAE